MTFTHFFCNSTSFRCERHKRSLLLLLFLLSLGSTKQKDVTPYPPINLSIYTYMYIYTHLTIRASWDIYQASYKHLLLGYGLSIIIIQIYTHIYSSCGSSHETWTQLTRIPQLDLLIIYNHPRRLRSCKSTYL